MILLHSGVCVNTRRGLPGKAAGHTFRMVSDGAPASMFPPLLCYTVTFLNLMSTVGNAESPPSTLFHPQHQQWAQNSSTHQSCPNLLRWLIC